MVAYPSSLPVAGQFPTQIGFKTAECVDLPAPRVLGFSQQVRVAGDEPVPRVADKSEFAKSGIHIGGQAAPDPLCRGVLGKLQLAVKTSCSVDWSEQTEMAPELASPRRFHVRSQCMLDIGSRRLVDVHEHDRRFVGDEHGVECEVAAWSAQA